MPLTNPRIEDTTPTPRVALGVMFAIVDLPASEHRRLIVTALRRRGAFLRRCRLFVLKVDLRESFTRGGQPGTPTKGRIQNTPENDNRRSPGIAFSQCMPVDQRTRDSKCAFYPSLQVINRPRCVESGEAALRSTRTTKRPSQGHEKTGNKSSGVRPPCNAAGGLFSGQ